MTVFYQNTPPIINSNKIGEFIAYLKKELRKIKEEILLKRIQKREYEKEVKIILSTMEKIARLLEENPLFKEKEFYDFLNMQHMSEYILKDIECFMNYSMFIDELIIEFKDLIHKKIQMAFEKEEINYKEEYDQFEDFLFEREEYFYLNIYQAHGEYNDLIVEITNIPRSD